MVLFFSRSDLLNTLVFCSLCMSLPAGYKFHPTEEELVVYYLENKVFRRPIPPDVIQEYGDDDIFGKSPKDVVASSSKGLGKECYFFIPQDEDFDGRNEIIRMVGNGLGFWKSSGDEKALFNINGEIFALKMNLTYFSGRPSSEPRKTHWRMEVYRLPTESYTNHNFKVDFQGQCM
ncbi:hypothetical protein LWI28_000679 [Acer negundo]|uniref:NAC domain-containing protein n=1 Tax=Acer negundo TaxID=4023 RepID=A0AAD5IP95_ACENE|nr:hypothetical protein LWI28_000679 [Acer negundo]